MSNYDFNAAALRRTSVTDLHALTAYCREMMETLAAIDPVLTDEANAERYKAAQYYWDCGIQIRAELEMRLQELFPGKVAPCSSQSDYSKFMRSEFPDTIE